MTSRRRFLCASIAVGLIGCGLVGDDAPPFATDHIVLCVAPRDDGLCPAEAERLGSDSRDTADLFPTGTGTIHLSLRRQGAPTASTANILVGTRSLEGSWRSGPWDGGSVVVAAMDPPPGGWPAEPIEVVDFSGGARSYWFRVAPEAPPHP